MSQKATLSELRQRIVGESLKDLWWLARNGVTYRSPMSLQAVELTMKKNPQGDYQICHVRDNGDSAGSWFVVNAAAPARKVESRGNTTIFRAHAPGPSQTQGLSKPPPPSKASISFAPEKPARIEKSFSERFDEVNEMMTRMEEKLNRLLGASDLLRTLESRERYLHEAEEMVTRKGQALEQEREELELLRDELEKRRFRLGSA